MNKEEKEFYIHKHYAKSSPVAKPKVTCWQLTYIQTGERIIHGEYSLCTWKRKQMTNTKSYKIEPYKK